MFIILQLPAVVSKTMDRFILAALLLGAASASLYDLSAIDIDGNNVPLSKFAGNVSLVVNVATYWYLKWMRLHSQIRCR